MSSTNGAEKACSQYVSQYGHAPETATYLVRYAKSVNITITYAQASQYLSEHYPKENNKNIKKKSVSNVLENTGTNNNTNTNTNNKKNDDNNTSVKDETRPNNDNIDKNNDHEMPTKSDVDTQLKKRPYSKSDVGSLSSQPTTTTTTTDTANKNKDLSSPQLQSNNPNASSSPAHTGMIGDNKPPIFSLFSKPIIKKVNSKATLWENAHSCSVHAPSHPHSPSPTAAQSPNQRSRKSSGTKSPIPTLTEDHETTDTCVFTSSTETIPKNGVVETNNNHTGLPIIDDTTRNMDEVDSSKEK